MAQFAVLPLTFLDVEMDSQIEFASDAHYTTDHGWTMAKAYHGTTLRVAVDAGQHTFATLSLGGGRTVYFRPDDILSAGPYQTAAADQCRALLEQAQAQPEPAAAPSTRPDPPPYSP